jgi:hypothetical protein
MKFRHSFCDPFKKDIVELGDLPAEKIIETFENIPWADYLKKMEVTEQSAIYYSPSFEIENKETQHGLSISAVGTPDNFEYYIFYKRPRQVKKIFGLINTMNNNYLTDITGQTKKDVLECLDALRNGNLDLLDNKVK